MDNRIKQINVEDIMTEIRQEIEEKGYKNEDVSFTDIAVGFSSYGIAHSKAFEENLGTLRARYNVAAYRPLYSNRAIGFIVVFIKKVMRKLTKFYIEPIVKDQNENNRLTTMCIQDLYLDTEEMIDRIQRLEDEIIKLKEKLNSQ